MAVELSVIWAIVILFVVLLLTFVGYLIYSGLFEPIEIRAGKPPFKNLLIAYKFSRGPYKNAGALFTECYNLAPQLRCIGLYYDHPNEVAAKNLRYVVGSILAEGDDVEDEKKNQYVELMTSHGFKIAQLPSVSHTINVKFPFKNTLSIFLAVWRVYPRLDYYIKEKSLCAHPMIEVYEGDVIHIVAPLAKQDEFYVPEAHQTVTEAEDGGDGKDEESEEEEASLPVVPEAFGDVAESEVASNLLVENSPQLTPDCESKEGSVSNGEESTGSSFEELIGENELDK